MAGVKGQSGNFGNEEQRREAGQQSSGNQGNPEQHSEAGKQSHKNDE